MGKNYDEKLRKIAAFEQEMVEFAKRHGKTFSMKMRVKKDILRLSAESSVDEVLDGIRDGIKQIILKPGSGFPRTPDQVLPPEEPWQH